MAHSFLSGGLAPDDSATLLAMSKLAVSIFVHDLTTALGDAHRAQQAGADLVELRIDPFFEPGPPSPAKLAAVVELVNRCPLPCIFTCRPVWEGGLYEGDEQSRLSIIEHAGLAEHPPAYLDIELAAYQRSANLRQKVHLVVDHPSAVRPQPTQLILSSHDFQSRPADLTARLEAMTIAPAARVQKIVWACPPGDLRDSLDLLKILHQRQKPTIALGMGETGLLTRVLAQKFGGHVSFCTLDDQQGTAPGQVSISTMRGLYGWNRINPATLVFGVIGWPVGHSMSPPIHNAGFASVGFDGVYLPMPISPGYESFAGNLQALLAFKELNFRGASVTIPHKENLIRFVKQRNHPGDFIEPLAEKIGAANTLVVRDDGTLAISNTDYAAALDAVCDGLSISRHQLAGKRVAVLGAGGAARAIVAGFAHHGATVVVYNRTFDRARQLADEFDGQGGKVVAARFEKLCDTCCEVIINCTPVGMHPNVDASPLDMHELPQLRTNHHDPDQHADVSRYDDLEVTETQSEIRNSRFEIRNCSVVFDTIYHPVQTRLLRDAAAKGCVTIPGVEMFVRQAVGQFELWTQQAAPTELFRQVTLKRLSPG